MWGKNVNIFLVVFSYMVFLLKLPAIFKSIHISLKFLLFQGVMEAIRISCAGYPTKRPFDEFVDRFGILAPEVLDSR